MRETRAVLPVRLSAECELRQLGEDDAAQLYAVIDANRAYLSRWMPWAATQTPGDTLEFIRLTRRQSAENNGFQVGIIFDGSIAGVAGFYSVDWTNGATSIGYWLAEHHQGRGTMSRAVRVLLDYAFSVWKVNRVEIRTAPDNERSRALAERLGFREEGTLRQAERVGERLLDNVVYSMLASEWQAHDG
jgi:ribosomal-protein-serine acetyltransferase